MNRPISANILGSIGTFILMFSSGSAATRYSSIMALTLVIFSAGFVVAHACHSDRVAQSTLVGLHEITDRSASGAVDTNSFAAGICTAVFFLALFASRKYLLKEITNLAHQTKSHFFFLRSILQRPPNAGRALSLFQLGVIRI